MDLLTPKNLFNFLMPVLVRKLGIGLAVIFSGILLLSEGGHLSHLTLFGYAVTPMSKATFYFVIAVLVFVEIVQTQYSKAILAKRQALYESKGATT